MAEIVLITGLSGAGRSEAAHVLEDIGWYVVDNLPTELIDTIIALADQPGSEINRLALVVGRYPESLLPKISDLRADDYTVTVLFLDANPPRLVERYAATQRRHPLADDASGMVEAIELERQKLEPVRAEADLVVDTTDLNIHQLSDRLSVALGQTSPERQRVVVSSFGFKHGAPRDADIVMDVRFLPNPHWQLDLRPLTGLDQPVREHVLGSAASGGFVEKFSALLADLLPRYSRGKSHLNVAIGCTGGRHRSVAVAEELAARLRESGAGVDTRHRDIDQ